MKSYKANEILKQFLKENNLTQEDFDKQGSLYDLENLATNLERHADTGYHEIHLCINIMEFIDKKNPLIADMVKLFDMAIDEEIQSLKDIRRVYAHQYLSNAADPHIECRY